MLTHEVITEHVHKVAPLRDTDALLRQVDQLFGLSHIDRQVPGQQLPRTVFDKLVQQRDARAAASLLLTSLKHGAITGAVRGMLANDLASPLWHGSVSWAHYPLGQEPSVGAAFHLYTGERSWLFELVSQDTVVVAEATRQRVADAMVRAFERVPEGERRYQL